LHPVYVFHRGDLFEQRAGLFYSLKVTNNEKQGQILSNVPDRGGGFSFIFNRAAILMKKKSVSPLSS
jgi:hypothetical protein